MLLLARGVLPALLASCASSPRDPLLTYFNGDYFMSVRYPASWKTEQAEQEGVWYRYFLGPPGGPQRKPAVSVTLLAGPLSGGLDDYAQTYLAGNTVSSSRDDSRSGARGRSYDFRSPDGTTRHALLLLQVDGSHAPQAKNAPGPQGRVYGLYAQGEKDSFERHLKILEEMARSLTLERAADYPEQRNQKFRVSIRMPPSWKSTRNFSGDDALLMQFTSPALATDRSRQTAHASLTLSVEKIEGDVDIDAFYDASRRKLGDSFPVVSHTPWRGGYLDVMSIETPIASSHIRRFYKVAEGRGYSLAFEARDDVYPRASRWCDMIAATLRVGPEVGQP